MTDRKRSSQAVLEDPRDFQASRDPQDPQVSKASEGYQDSQEKMDPKDSRVSQETQVVKGFQDPQGSWGLEDPKARWASLARMDSQVPAASLDQSGPQGTKAFLVKSWEPSLDPGEMLGCPDTPD